MSLKKINIILLTLEISVFIFLSLHELRSPGDLIVLVAVIAVPFITAYLLFKRNRLQSNRTLWLLMTVSIVTILITTISGVWFTFFDRFFITGATFFTVGYYFRYLHRQPIRWVVLLHCLFIPQLLLFMPVILFWADFVSANLLPYASVLAVPLIIMTGALRRKWVGIGISIGLISLISFIVYPNYISYYTNKITNKQDTRAKLALVNEQGDTLSVAALAPKIVVIDLWYSGCGICYKKFPQFDRLREYYKDNPNIIFAAVNVPTERDEPGIAFSYIRKYGFVPLQATAPTKAKEWKVSGYPTILMYDHKGKLRFEGSLETERTIANNAYAMVDKLLKE